MSSKYYAKKTERDGIVFASQREAARYCELKRLERAGKIQDLRLQVPFILVERSQYGRAIKYIADFVYNENDQMVAEDVKGYQTDVYKLKKRLLAEQGIKIRET